MAGAPTVPFRPGYALGSIIPYEVMDAMVKESKLTITIENIEVMIRKFKSVVEEIKSKGGTRDMLANMEKRIGDLEKSKIDAQVDYMNWLIDYPQPRFEVSESPIDWSKSEYSPLPRGFDTLNFNSTYIMKDEIGSKVDDMCDQMAGSASYSGWFVSANISANISKRIYKTSSSGKSEGSLVIGAFATTRHVRTFTKMVFDYDKLVSLKKDMEKKSKKEVFIISEAVMGGCFTGLAHFLKTEESQQSQEKKATEYSGSVSIGSLGGASGESKSASENSSASSVANTNVQIEFNCYGSVPGFSRKDVPYKMSDFKSLAPSEMKLSVQDEEDVKAMSGGGGLWAADGGDANKRSEIASKQRLKMQYAGSVITSALRETITAEKPQKIHNLECLYEAFESWVTFMKEDLCAGVPVGFNYRILKIEDIDKIINEMDREKGLKEQQGFTQQQYPVRKVNVVLEHYKGISELFGNLLSLSDEDASSSLVVNVIFEMERERNDTQDLKERIEKYPNGQNLVFVFCWAPRKNANPNVCPNEQQLASLASLYHFQLVLVKYKSEFKNNEMITNVPDDEKQKVASAVKEVKERLKA